MKMESDKGKKNRREEKTDIKIEMPQTQKFSHFLFISFKASSWCDNIKWQQQNNININNKTSTHTFTEAKALASENP